jgi:hypothetical protein
MDDNQHKEEWEKLGSIEIKMIQKDGKCTHALNDKFCYKNPYTKPENVCTALLHVLDLYTWRVALGFPSWEKDNRNVYRIHCPSKKGTVWEMRKINKDQ